MSWQPARCRCFPPPHPRFLGALTPKSTESKVWINWNCGRRRRAMCDVSKVWVLPTFPVAHEIPPSSSEHCPPARGWGSVSFTCANSEEWPRHEGVAAMPMTRKTAVFTTMQGT